MKKTSFYMILISFVLGNSSSLFAQTGAMGQPEFSSYEPVGTGVNVTPQTGDMTYALPVFSIPGSGGGYTMSPSLAQASACASLRIALPTRCV